MYHNHVGTISAAMKGDKDVFASGVMFAVLSARTQFPRILEQCDDLSHKGDSSNVLWGWKFDAYHYLQEFKHSLWDDVTVLAPTLEDKLFRICQVPGIGIVKGAFILQLLGHDIACLDTRNVQRLGLNPREYRSDGENRKSLPSFKRKINRYINDTYGKAAEMWNDWCKDAGHFYGIAPEIVSHMHVKAIVPRKMRKLTQLVPLEDTTWALIRNTSRSTSLV